MQSTFQSILKRYSPRKFARVSEITSAEDLLQACERLALVKLIPHLKKALLPKSNDSLTPKARLKELKKQFKQIVRNFQQDYQQTALSYQAASKFSNAYILVTPLDNSWKCFILKPVRYCLSPRLGMSLSINSLKQAP
jgi:hypothetical protein